MTSIALIQPLRFKTFDEIATFPGFIANNPLKMEDYGRHLGYYELPELVQCCLCKENGSLCGTDHKIGFVVRLKDGTITIVGGCCGRDKFPEESEFHAQAKRTLQEVKRLDRLTGLVELLGAREANERLIAELHGRLTVAHKVMHDFKASLGEMTARALERMIKESRNSVYVDAVYFKRWVDADGREHQERIVRPFNIGTLAYGNAYSARRYVELRRSLDRIRHAYDSAAQRINKDPKQSEISELAGIIGKLPTVQRHVAEYEKNVEACLTGNLKPLLYLVDNRSDRYKTARAILQLQGETAGKKVAKEWLRGMDDILKSQAPCDEIRARG